MSNYTEREIMSVSINLIEEAGEMTTTELKEALHIEMEPTGNDLEILSGRNDTKFDQKVRNMVSHRDNNDLLVYFDYRREGSNGVLTSKSINGISDQNLLVERKRKAKTFRANKVNFDEINARNKEIGLLGEAFVLKLEKSMLPTELADKVVHTSVEEGDGTGYDILSYHLDGTVKFIEVKTTTGSLKTPFYFSENERLFLEMFKDELEIVRVYDFDRENEEGKIKRIKGVDFLASVEMQPIAYKVKFKD